MTKIRCFKTECYYNSKNKICPVKPDKSFHYCMMDEIAVSSDLKCMDYEHKDDYEL